MIQENSTRPKEVPGAPEVFRQEILANVLKHADANQLIELKRQVQITVIADFHFTAIGDASVTEAITRIFRLGNAECDSKYVCTIVLRGVNHQTAPAATEVQQTVALLDSQLFADVIQLL